MNTFKQLALVSLALLIAGCQKVHEKIGDAPRTEKPSAANGWKEVATSGTVVQLPNDWKMLDLTAKNLEEGVQAAFGKDPKYDQMRELVKRSAQSGLVKFMAFDSATVGSGYATTCNLVIEDLPTDMSVEQYASAAANQVRQIAADGKAPTVEYMDGKAGKIAVVSYEMKMPALGSNVASIAYVAVAGRKAAVVTFGSKLADEAHVRSIADQSMKAFRFQ